MEYINRWTDDPGGIGGTPEGEAMTIRLGSPDFLRMFPTVVWTVQDEEAIGQLLQRLFSEPRRGAARFRLPAGDRRLAVVVVAAGKLPPVA